MKIRLLLLGKKVMTNLDSVLKSGHITSPTKVFIVNFFFFLVAMYGYEGGASTKESILLNCGAGEDS